MAANNTIKVEVSGKQNVPELWDAKTIAEYLGLKVTTVHEYSKTESSFPGALVFGRCKRWVKSEIVEWAFSKRQKVSRAAIQARRL